MDIGPSEAEPFWVEFLRKLARRDLRGVKLVISDAHEGLKAAIAKTLCATLSRTITYWRASTVFPILAGCLMRLLRNMRRASAVLHRARGRGSG